MVGAQHAAAQKLQWFLSESSWDPAGVNQRRLALLMAESATAPTSEGVLVIDETGDRKWGDKTAHVGRQYLGSIGKGYTLDRCAEVFACEGVNDYLLHGGQRYNSRHDRRLPQFPLHGATR